MADRSRRRAGPSRTEGRARASAIARRLGVGLRETRLSAGLRQVDVATRAGIAQTSISMLERGLGRTVSLETWASVASAVNQQLAAFLEDAPGADRPRDYEHLKRQKLVIETAMAGGWRAAPEFPIDPTLTRSRTVDVYLERPARREAAVVEIWDFFDDVGAANRGLDGKIATVARRLAMTEAAIGGPPRAIDGPPRAIDGPPRAIDGRPAAIDLLPWRVGGLFVVRGTRRNRALVREFAAVFRARFPGSSNAWMAALRDPTAPLPSADALLWTDVAGTRLMPARLRR